MQKNHKSSLQVVHKSARNAGAPLPVVPGVSHVKVPNLARLPGLASHFADLARRSDLQVALEHAGWTAADSDALGRRCDDLLKVIAARRRLAVEPKRIARQVSERLAEVAVLRRRVAAALRSLQLAGSALDAPAELLRAGRKKLGVDATVNALVAQQGALANLAGELAPLLDADPAAQCAELLADLRALRAERSRSLGELRPLTRDIRAIALDIENRMALLKSVARNAFAGQKALLALFRKPKVAKRKAPIAPTAAQIKVVRDAAERPAGNDARADESSAA